MIKRIIFALLVLFGGFLLVRNGSTLSAAPPFQTDSATPTPAPEPEAKEEEETEHAPEAEEAATEPTLAELAAQVAALQAQVAALSAGSSAGQANEVTTAIYLLDTVGLHGLAERLNGEGVIESSDAGSIARVARLLSSVNWPAELATDAISVTATLNDLAAALGNDEVETAAPLATLAHESAHDLSHAAEQWLGEISVAGGHDAPGQAFRVTSAVYLLDTAGLHGLDVRLNEEGVIESSDAGTVSRVARLLSSVDWPEALATDAVSLTTMLNELATALGNDDVEAAAPLATQVHEAQHDFSHAAEQWLAEAVGGHGESEEHGHGEMSEEGDGHGHGEGEEQGEEGEESSESGG